MKNVLITYTSPKGSTEEVAQFIGRELTALGHQVTLLSMSQVTELGYDGVIIAAPVNGMNWRPEALEFIETHRTELNNKSVSYVALALMVDQGRPFFRNAVQKVFNKATSIVAPTATAIFGGVANDPMPSFMRWVFGLPKDMPKDNRNWSKIETFSRKIHQNLENIL